MSVRTQLAPAWQVGQVEEAITVSVGSHIGIEEALELTDRVEVRQMHARRRARMKRGDLNDQPGSQQDDCEREQASLPFTPPGRRDKRRVSVFITDFSAVRWAGTGLPSFTSGTIKTTGRSLF